MSALAGGTPVRAADDESPVPYQLALPVQQLLDAIVGDDYFELSEIVPLLSLLADLTSDGVTPAPGLRVWTGAELEARVRELVDLYNPPVECGGEPLGLV